MESRDLFQAEMDTDLSEDCWGIALIKMTACWRDSIEYLTLVAYSIV